MDEVQVPNWVEDAALDFAEEVVGRYDFSVNWRRISEDSVNRTLTVYSWLSRNRFDPEHAEELITVLDRLAEGNVRWRQ